MMAPVLPNLIDRDDVRMIEIGSRFGLVAESLDFGRRRSLPRTDHFQRDGPIQTNLPRVINHPHPALGYFPK